MTTTPISFDKFTTDAGVGECYILRGSEVIGHVSRERPTKYHGNGVGGLVSDRSKPWEYVAEIDGQEIEIPDGATLREAKALLRAASC